MFNYVTLKLEATFKLREIKKAKQLVDEKLKRFDNTISNEIRRIIWL